MGTDEQDARLQEIRAWMFVRLVEAAERHNAERRATPGEGAMGALMALERAAS